MGIGMKVGSRGDYGLRALIFLCTESGSANGNSENAALARPVQIHTIAKSQAIPEDYLRQLLVILKDAGLVRSVRGPRGGYLLAQPADHISMAQVLEILEGPPNTMKCSYHAGERDELCSVIGGCQMRQAWRQAQDARRQVLSDTTIAALAAADANVRDS